jgi:cell division protein ZapA
VVGIERIAIMAALNISHELLRTKVTCGVDLGEVKRKIGSMQASIDAAMKTQDQLF